MSIKLCDKNGNGCFQQALPKATGTPISITKGEFVAKKLASASAIVTSAKRYSLCLYTTPKSGGLWTCHPIKAPVMKGAEISAVTGLPKLTYVITFPQDKGVAPSAELLARRAKSSAVFSKALYDAQVAATKVATKRYAGHLLPRSNVAAEGGGSGCSWDEEGNIYCDGDPGTGGGGGNPGPGTNGDDQGGGYPDTPDQGEDNGDDSDNGGGAGNDNGSGDSTTPTSTQTNWDCVTTPAGTVCTGTAKRPPVVGGEPQLPPNNPPWFPQSWCDFWSVLCSEGQEPADNPRTGESTSGKTMEELYQDCNDDYETDMDVCKSIGGMGGDWRIRYACEGRAAGRLATCQSTARRLTNNGTRTAP